MVKISKGINIPLNRAEGDLEINVEIDRRRHYRGLELRHPVSRV